MAAHRWRRWRRRLHSRDTRARDCCRQCRRQRGDDCYQDGAFHGRGERQRVSAAGPCSEAFAASLTVAFAAPAALALATTLCVAVATAAAAAVSVASAAVSVSVATSVTVTVSAVSSVAAAAIAAGLTSAR